MPWPARRSHPDGICHPSLRQCGRKRGPLRPAPPPVLSYPQIHLGTRRPPGTEHLVRPARPQAEL
jgi:hypothetical protein